MEYMFCKNRNESIELESLAKSRVPTILEELSHYVKSSKEIGITVHRVLYPFSGWCIEADLTFDGEVVRHYESFDLLELELNFLELNILMKNLRRFEY